MKRLKKRIWHTFLIVLVGCETTVFLAARGEEERLPEAHKQALSVETVPVQKMDYRVRVPAWGFVEPRETIDVRPEISGKVTDVQAGVFTGAEVEEGAFLFSIDERDYRNALKEAMAANEQALQELEIEKGRQAVARTEWKLLENSHLQEHQNKALALRVPQLKERKAAIQMAAARQAQAALDVERARITAPCEGVIIEECLAKGQVLDTDYVAAQIACTDCYHIVASFSPGYSLDPGERVVEIDVGPNSYEGVIKAVLPRIDPETRQKQSLVEFRGEGVLLGAYASLTLPGPSFKNVAVLPKEALRHGNTVWVLSENSTLEIRNVAVLAQDMLNAVIGEGLKAQDHVILSHIASPLQGMNLHRAIPITEGSQKNVDNKGQGQ